jgi:coenzyme Q-binding protein COQ10
MPQFTTKRRVRHSAAEMFDLVADVERYPEFLPFCRELIVRQRTPGPDGTEVLVADLTVAYKMIHESFTSRVIVDKPNLRIMVNYLRGPFRHLENSWNFRPLTDATSEVTFFIEYEFKSRTLGFLMGAMFDVVFRSYASAFEKRADVIYAKTA